MCGADVAQTIEICVDSFFYRKLTCVPFNIVYYNVFAGPGRGPDIYGTEPWSFYLLNLTLNFNIWLPLALCALPLAIGYHYMRGQVSSNRTASTIFVITTPLYLWLVVMSLQAHKEERFMYPIYPSLALNAALSVHHIILLVSQAGKDTFVGRLPTWCKTFALGSIILTSALLGIWRSAGLATAYGAPLLLYKQVENVNLTNMTSRGGGSDINVCVGKEWYRFPSSYHLAPFELSEQTFRLRFIPSAFHGLLPGAFTEELASHWLDISPGTWIEPVGMNDQNIEDLGKYTSIEDCDFLVDSAFETTASSKEEPDYVLTARSGDSEWRIVACERFLDQSRSGILGRLGWFPEWLADSHVLPFLMARRWGDYCLLQRKQ